MMKHILIAPQPYERVFRKDLGEGSRNSRNYNSSEIHGYLLTSTWNFVLTPRHFMPIHDAEFIPGLFRHRLAGAVQWIQNFAISGIIVGERMKKALASVVPSFSFLSTKEPRQRPSQICRLISLVRPPRRMIKLQLFDYGAYCPAAKPLTGELLEFVSDPKSKGTILVAFGTVINWENVPKEKFEAVLEALNSLSDYRIVWAYNGRPMTMKPHIYASKWVPQVDVLFDNRTVLLFSHGGLKRNTMRIGSIRPHADCLPDKLGNRWIEKEISFFSFASNAARITTLFNDKVLHPLDQGAHYINRLLKYGGRMPEFFYPRAISRDYLSYLNIDIFLVPLLVIILISC
ncbi:hypothetical protein COOONC_05872 [Cooperia oncophora]